MAKSKFWQLIDGYDASASQSVGKSFAVFSYSGTVKQKTKHSLSHRISDLAERISRLFSYTSTKAYGALSLTFGILTLIFHFSGEYFGAYKGAGNAALIIGIVFSLLSIPLLLIDRPIGIVFQDLAIIEFILFEFFCMKRVHRVDNPPSIHPIVAACFGATIALLGFFVPIQIILVIISALTFIYFSLASPEFSYIVTLLVLPYISHLPYAEYVFFGIICVTLVSFLRKVVCGKRVIHIEQYDILIGFFIFALLISGIFVKGVDSFTGSLGLFVLSLGYLLTSNIVANRRLADCAINAVALSSLPAAIIAFYEVISAAFSNVGLEVLLAAGVGSSFGDPAAYAAYLIIAIPLILIRVTQSRGVIRFLYFLLLILNTGAVIFTAQRFAWLVLLIGIALFFSYRAKYVAPFVIILLFVLPYVLILLPGDATAFIFTSSDIALLPSRIIELWAEALRVLSENPLVGIGIGKACFAEEFLPLGFEGIENSHNFFIEIGLEAGIGALAIFLLLLIVRLRHRAMYQRYLKESDMSLVSTMTAITTSALIILGTTYYLFENMEITYLFWFVFGLGGAALRVAKRERDDKVLYYEDTKSPNSSVAEIKIK